METCTLNDLISNLHESVNEILRYGHSNEISWAELLHGTFMVLFVFQYFAT